ncbi:hypothetical protein EDC94DRAFT_615519 [Helicostylum pulchrum]|nr:hypothetical protein EDC94DRAFT_615519 [Helicostylum pulchrum]
MCFREDSLFFFRIVSVQFYIHVYMKLYSVMLVFGDIYRFFFPCFSFLKIFIAAILFIYSSNTN